VGKGTGLGLAMVYGIIKSHHGYMSVYSEPGLGTTMRIYLPKADGYVEERGGQPVFDGKKSKATILLIDDEDVVRELARDILEAYNYRVLLAIHGNDGIRIFNEHQDEIDLVILDMIMPEKGGKQVFRELRAIKPDVRVVVSSGYGQDEYFHELFDAGIQGFLQKPFVHSDLIRRVEDALRS
jgi:CheY-like chemotaxis protein